jgi:hypothetical protein
MSGWIGHSAIPIAYGPNDAPRSIPAPAISLDDIGVERWHYDIWHQIIRAALDGHPDEVDLSYHRALDKPAVSRYGATPPALLRWFKTYNQSRPYPDQVKPFNFLVSFFSRLDFELSEYEQDATPRRGRPRKLQTARPVAAYDKDIAKAARYAFDRETGKPVPAHTLMTYKEALAQYHLRSEAKFLNAEFADRDRRRLENIGSGGRRGSRRGSESPPSQQRNGCLVPKNIEVAS